MLLQGKLFGSGVSVQQWECPNIHTLVHVHTHSSTTPAGRASELGMSVYPLVFL